MSFSNSLPSRVLPPQTNKTKSVPLAVIFDVDGTLLDYAGAQLQAVGNDPELFRLVNSPEVQSYEARGVPEPEGGMREFLEGYYQRLSTRGDLMPEVPKTLAALARTMKLAVVSNGPRQVQDARLAAGGIIDYFPVRVYSRDEGVAKPNPAILGIALERLGVTALQAVFVGDSPTNDMAAANAAGVRFVWYRSDGRFQNPGERIAEMVEMVQLPGILTRNSREGRK